jgi:hypothetical protein
MAKVRLVGDAAGYTELSAPPTAGNNTITLPTGNGSANQLLKNTSVAGTLGWSSLVESSSGELLSSSLGTAAAPAWSFSTDPNTGIYSPGADQVAIATNGTGRLFVDSSGRLLVGTSSVYNVPTGDGGIRSPGLQRAATTFADSSISSTLFNTATEGGGTITLSRSNTTTLGAQAIAASQDATGSIWFSASDGVTQIPTASIVSRVDGTPGTNDMPGRLVFSTTDDGASSPTERVRIANTGAVGLSGANYGTAGQIIKSQGSSAAPIWGNAINYQEFLSSGTWTKPAGAISVYVEVVGGGGGGGSGGRYATSLARMGGGGGAGGVYLNRWFKASDLGATVSVTVGASGAGAAAVLTDSAGGTNGTSGGESSFGTLLLSGTAGAGGGGSTINGAGGVISSRANDTSQNIHIFAGSGAVGNAAKASSNGFNAVYGGAGGGGGNGGPAGTVPNQPGGSGGVVTTLAASMTGAAAGVAGATGGGGGGGSYVTATTGMSGGAGGFPGGGGGGGSGSDNGFNSGAGGAGGAGIVRVWSY